VLIHNSLIDKWLFYYEKPLAQFTEKWRVNSSSKNQPVGKVGKAPFFIQENQLSVGVSRG
jgi:hypothetical protein